MLLGSWSPYSMKLVMELPLHLLVPDWAPVAPFKLSLCLLRRESSLHLGKEETSKHMELLLDIQVRFPLISARITCTRLGTRFMVEGLVRGGR